MVARQAGPLARVADRYSCRRWEGLLADFVTLDEVAPLAIFSIKNRSSQPTHQIVIATRVSECVNFHALCCKGSR